MVPGTHWGPQNVPLEDTGKLMLVWIMTDRVDMRSLTLLTQSGSNISSKIRRRRVRRKRNTITSPANKSSLPYNGSFQALPVLLHVIAFSIVNLFGLSTHPNYV